MTADEITAKKEELTTQFNSLVKQREEIDAELNRLQGKYQLIEEMADPAKTVKAEAKSGK